MHMESYGYGCIRIYKDYNWDPLVLDSIQAFRDHAWLLAFQDPGNGLGSAAAVAPEAPPAATMAEDNCGQVEKSWKSGDPDGFCS